MKRQKQIDESKQMIASAFTDLLRDHEFGKLTLGEIADHAGVTRMTLYRHFKSKEKIILYSAQKALEEQSAQIRESGKSMKELVIHRLERVKSLPHVARLLRNRDLEEILYNFRMTSHKATFEKLSGKRFEDDPFFFHFLLGGINNMIREWLKNDCRESSRELADKIISMSRACIGRPVAVDSPDGRDS
jgi:AcrR family transcriptional regulator